ncbi:ABC transporter ATP-binding protein [Candidatus Phytoplasma sacchari]
MNFLSIQKVNKIFINKNNHKGFALKNINLNFSSSGLICIVGKTGSGKTTFLNLLSGFESYDSGKILINGIENNNLIENKINNYRSRVLGMVFQESCLFATLNIQDNITLPLELRGESWNTEKMDHLLEELEIANLKEQKVIYTSGGEKQRISLCRTIFKNPYFFLVDEPTGNLDFETSIKIFKILKKISEKKLVIIITHDLLSAYTYADRIIEFSNGEVISDLSKKKIKNDETIRNTNYNLSSVSDLVKIFKKNFDLTEKNELKFERAHLNHSEMNKNNPSSLNSLLLKKQFPLTLKIIFKIFKENKKSLFIKFYFGIIALFCSWCMTNSFSSFHKAIVILIKNKKLSYISNNYFIIISLIFSLILYIISSLIICYSQFVQHFFKSEEKNISILKYLGVSSQNIRKIFYSKNLLSWLTTLLVLFLFFVLFCFQKIVSSEWTKILKWFSIFNGELTIKEVFNIFLLNYFLCFIFFIIPTIIIIKLKIKKWYNQKNIKFIN